MVEEIRWLRNDRTRTRASHYHAALTQVRVTVTGVRMVRSLEMGGIERLANLKVNERTKTMSEEQYDDLTGQNFALKHIAKHIGCHMPTYQAVQKHWDKQQGTITRLTAELAEAHEFINSKFDPVFALNVKMADELAASRAEFIGAMTSLGSMADELTTARADAARLREDLQEAIHRLGDMYDDDDGQAWKEAMKFLNRMEALAASEKGVE